MSTLSKVGIASWAPSAVVEIAPTAFPNITHSLSSFSFASAKANPALKESPAAVVSIGSTINPGTLVHLSFLIIAAPSLPNFATITFTPLSNNACAASTRFLHYLSFFQLKSPTLFHLVLNNPHI